MKIDLSNLFNGSQDSLSVSHSVDLSDLIFGTYCPVKEPVKVNGKIFTKADIVYLKLNISFIMDGFCDRCAEEVRKDYSIDIKKILVEELQNEDDDNYIIVENHILDLDELINEEVSLGLPSKLLCKDDCKGLCQKCGANLNVKKCDCKSDVDPRMQALLQLLDNE